MIAVSKDNSFDESIVLGRLSEGSEDAFRMIYELYHARVYRVAERFLQNHFLAQDVVQEVFSSIWAHRKEMTKIHNLEAYIRTTARNHIYTFLRKISYEEKQRAVYLRATESSVNNCDFGLLNDQNEQLLSKILSNLPVRQQEVFNLSRNEGLSHDHIAERLNISQGTVKNHMVRALQTIKQQLSPYLDSNFIFLIYLVIR